MLFALLGLLKPGVEKHLPPGDEINEHLAQPFRHTRLAGYLCREDQSRSGLLMLVEADSFAEAEAHLHQSPFFKANLYERVEIAEYSLEVGRLD
jgi:uncharacterized protein YciI